MSYSDWIGSAGVFLILLAFCFSTFKIISPNSNLFFAMNTIGAAAACYASYLIRYTPFIILEGTWTVVSLLGWMRRKK